MTPFELQFAKAHAYGNDFLYVRQADAAGLPPDALARALCDRHAGIGADGLILYDGTSTQATMRLFNADGSRAEVSGNGVRGLAALLLRGDNSPGAVIAIRTEGGVKRLVRTDVTAVRQTFRAEMGAPLDLRQVSIDIDGEVLPAVVLNMGNPQCVILGPLPSDEAFSRIGHAVERHHLFREGTNVEFVQVETIRDFHECSHRRHQSRGGLGSAAGLCRAASSGFSATHLHRRARS